MIDIAQVSVQASEALVEHIAPLKLHLYTDFISATQDGCSLVVLLKDDQLSLASAELGENSALTIDFISGRLAHRRIFGGGRNQEICRAIGLNRNPNLSIVDATSGLGRDAFVLAVNGASVTGFEKNPLLASMLSWSLQQAKDSPQAETDCDLMAALNRLSFICADSSQALKAGSFDVVYLDPMFPQREKSAKVKKDMQILHLLLSNDRVEEKDLFDSAWSAANARLVIKRPVNAPLYAQQKPHHQVSSKNLRYDVYVKKAIT